MPGSTSSLSESSKAKVTSATNGVFVRPVAVAGIFCPTNDNSNSSPPALPEKKRFSAVAGDLRSCSTNDKSEDFSKRRQSWDVQQKEILFGQALLRKTPRRIEAPAPRTVKPNSVGNGTAPEISSFPSDDKNSLISPVNKLPDSSKVSEPPNNGSWEIDANNSSVKNKDTVNGLKEKSNNLSSSKQVSKELSSIKSEVKKETQLTTSDLPTENISHQGKKVLENKSSASSEIVKQTKKVYGLIKRESKSEVSPISNDCSTSAANVDVKNAIKPKVYGLNKQNTKKDVEINKSENELSVEKRNLQTSSVESSLTVEKKDLKSSSVESSSTVVKRDLKSPSVEPPLPEKNLVKTNETSESEKLCQEDRISKSPPKDFRTVRRTSDVIAARIQTIFSNFQSEKPTPSLLKKSKISDKTNTSTTKISNDKSDKKETNVSALPDNKGVSDIKNLNAKRKSDPDFKDQTVKVSTIDSSSSKKELKSTITNSKDKETKDSVIIPDNKVVYDIKNLNTEKKSPPVLTNQAITVSTSDSSSSKKELKYTSTNSKDKKETKDSVIIPDNKVVYDIKKLNTEKKSPPVLANQAITVSTSDLSSPKKELKSTITSSKEKSNLGNEVVNLQGVSKVPLLKKEDSKTESLINTASKQVDKKVPNTEGKMPIKKDDKSSSEGTKLFTITTNQETDRKSSDLTVTSNRVMQTINKDPGVKKFSNKQSFGVSEDRNSKVAVSSHSLNNSLVKEVVQSDNIKRIKTWNTTGINFESNISNKESVTSQASISQSLFTSNSLQSTISVTQKSSETSYSKCQKTSETKNTFINGNAETTTISKIEVTKITPSTVPGIVPTVNVVFRTKSPIETNKEENRKKVLIETCTNSAPISSAVIISPKPLNAPSVTTAVQSVDKTLKTVENFQKSVNSSPKLPEKHTKRQLSNLISPSPSNSGEKIESKVAISAGLNHTLASNIPTSSNKSEIVETSTTINKAIENNISTSKTADKLIENMPPTYTTKQDIIDPNKTNSTGRASDVLDKVSVVDLNDWNKKFQRIEPEVPRAPLRRRAQRDSLPPLLPSRSPSRFGSLRRIDDSPRYLPRSPSQSSLPQRYSYTEMLSKVCSMGVLPLAEPMMSKSCSSSSSQVSELWSELSEEQSSATHASEMLESETSERMRLEKEVHELQNRFSHVQQRSDKMEMEIMESRVYRTPELNGDLSEDEDAEGNAALYKQKYERAVKDMELMKRRIQQQQEEEIEQKALMKKASDKRLAEALEDVDEERQIANQWKRKAQKCGAELQDLRLMLEEQMARNGELEKKQRRFDAELSAAQEEIKKEKLLREKFTREKDQAVHEKYSLEQDLQSAKIDADMLHEKIAQLTRELDELTLSSKGEEEVTQLKRAKQDLERKSRDQEEELEELAAQVQMLEQSKLRLEMSLEKVRQEHRREASVREEEIEEIRASFSKKIKNLEAQLESEQDERHQLVKQKHELERRLYEIADQPPPHDPEVERRLRRDLKRTKALLRDAQSMLEHTREGQSSKTLIRQLKNQLEDSEFAKATAIKARQAIETELQDCQLQLEEVTRAKNEAETKCLQLSREKSAIQTQLEEAEEEMAEVMKKYKAVVAQMSADQKVLAEQNQQIAELESERQMLKEQLNEVSHKFEHLAGQSDDTHKVHWLDSKIRDLESKLELEQTTKSRLENQIARLKEQNDRAREECDQLRNKEVQAQDAVRRLQRQIRDLREDYSGLQQKEADGYRKQHELEMALENMETDLQVTKNDLRLACQRIQDLQNALEDDLDSGTDVPDDSGSDSDSSFELSMLRNQSLTPLQRCESIASNLSYDIEGRHSRAASFTQELSAFSSRNDVEKDINGFPGLSNSDVLPDTEKDEMV